MNSQLDQILAITRRGVEERKAQASPALERMAAEHRPRGFARALLSHSATGLAVIAEIKKASPSRGMIRASVDVPALAAELASAGAAALSVLTEERFFQGSLRNLEMASAASGLPCLRKDFIVDGFQILEARAYRADAILLIAAVLSDMELKDLAAKARSLDLDVLLEIHTRDELDRVLNLDLDLSSGREVIGVNNRDLRSFEVNLDVSLNLAPSLPSGAVHVAESGIRTAEDLNRLRGAGFDAFLIGESLMRQPEPGQALESLIAAADRQRTPRTAVAAGK